MCEVIELGTLNRDGLTFCKKKVKFLNTQATKSSNKRLLYELELEIQVSKLDHFVWKMARVSVYFILVSTVCTYGRLKQS